MGGFSIGLKSEKTTVLLKMLIHSLPAGGAFGRHMLESFPSNGRTQSSAAPDFERAALVFIQ